MEEEQQKKRVLITGASRGLGRALAVKLSERGYQVVASARRMRDMADLEAVNKIALDVVDPASVTAAVKTTGEVDVLINNAAITLQGPFEAVPVEAARSVFETNMLGLLRLIQAFLPGMRERGRGLVINLSSGAVHSAAPLKGVYAASKAALEMLSEVLRFEVQHFGVQLIVVQLGGVRTEMTARQQKFSLDPYTPLVEQQEAQMAQYTKYGGGSPLEQVAGAVADLIERPSPPSRISVPMFGLDW